MNFKSTSLSVILVNKINAEADIIDKISLLSELKLLVISS